MLLVPRSEEGTSWKELSLQRGGWVHVGVGDVVVMAVVVVVERAKKIAHARQDGRLG